MKTISIFNHVLGPVMRGPSSSHTAGAYHIASMARSLLGGTPARAVLAFDPAGSYAATFVQQGADRAFAMGLMDKPLTDESFFTALPDAEQTGLDLCYQVQPLDNADHPNTVDLTMTSVDGATLRLVARSIGGGEVEITRVDGRPVLFSGAAYEILIEVPAALAPEARRMLGRDGALLEEAAVTEADGIARLTACRKATLPGILRGELLALDGAARLWESAPVYFMQTGHPLFTSADQLVRLAGQRGLSLGRLALASEAQLLGMSDAEVLAEILHRYDIMAQSVESGLAPNFAGLQLLSPCAGKIFQAEAAGCLSLGGPLTRAAARAMAVMHVDGAMGVVCAAPTGGSAGVIPGTLVTLAEERSLTREQIGLALLAAGAIGSVVAQRATFAAEVAGCQVEIGASGAMAAAAVVEAVGGSARQACDAAAIAFQNTMGSVCDLLHGMVEIPCHTRNAAAAASAFVNADLVLGGYPNPVPLDETIDAVFAVGLALPTELRCTSKGGLAITQAAQNLKPLCPQPGCSTGH